MSAGDRSPPAGAEPPRLSVWDLDGTILDGDTHAFIHEEVIRRSPATARRRAAALAVGLLWQVGLASDDRTKTVVARAFEGMHIEALRAWLAALVERRVLPRVRPPIRERIQADRDAGLVPVLLSASFEEAAILVGRALGFAHVAGTRLGVEDGVLRGDLDGEPLRGPAKARWLARFAREHGADLRRSRGYGDRGSDLDFLALVGEPFAVHPDAALRRFAVERGWPILAP